MHRQHHPLAGGRRLSKHTRIKTQIRHYSRTITTQTLSRTKGPSSRLEVNGLVGLGVCGLATRIQRISELRRGLPILNRHRGSATASVNGNEDSNHNSRDDCANNKNHSAGSKGVASAGGGSSRVGLSRAGADTSVRIARGRRNIQACVLQGAWERCARVDRFGWLGGRLGWVLRGRRLSGGLGRVLSR